MRKQKWEDRYHEIVIAKFRKLGLVFLFCCAWSLPSFAQTANWTVGTGNSAWYANNVGIGTSAPNAKLNVSGGDVNLDTLRYFRVAGEAVLGGDGASKLTFFGTTEMGYGTEIYAGGGGGSSPRMKIDSNGNVGIGTTSPSAKLEVKNAGGAGADNWVSFADSGGTRRLSIGIEAGWSSNVFDSGNIDLKLKSTFVGSSGGLVRFHTKDDGSESLRVDRNGFVGIGTASPTTRLHVVGDATFSGTVTGGNIQARYQDLAEWVPTSRHLQPGTVVMLDPQRSNSVLPSSSPYDTSVAGVVSHTPGILLGESGEGKVMIATTGRVKVRVRSDRPVKIGDLLVTSEQEGLAMISEPIDVGGIKIHRPGTLIGKVLEPMAPGTGEVLVLLSLQ